MKKKTSKASKAAPKSRQGARSSGTVAAPISLKGKRKAGATKATLEPDDRIAAHLATVGKEVAQGLAALVHAVRELTEAMADEIPEVEEAPASVTVPFSPPVHIEPHNPQT